MHVVKDISIVRPSRRGQPLHAQTMSDHAVIITDVSRDTELERSVASVAVGPISSGRKFMSQNKNITWQCCRMGYEIG